MRKLLITLTTVVSLLELGGTGIQGTGSSNFSLAGVRAENEVRFEFEIGDEPVKYHGSLMDATTIVGEMQLRTDTLPVTFTRD
jgi:hypothetical protein